MRFTYRLVRDTSGFVAECIETEAAGEGRTENDAVASLKSALLERLFRPDAIAPPSRPEPAPEIQLEPAEAEALSAS